MPVEPATAVVDPELCAGCGMCVEVRPSGTPALDSLGGVLRINAVLCKGCGACASACSSQVAQGPRQQGVHPLTKKILLNGYYRENWQMVGESKALDKPPLEWNIQPPGFETVTEATLQEIVRCIVEHLATERIVLLGSFAYGRPTPDSDVDLLVIMQTEARPVDRYLAVSRLIRPRPFPLDILVKTPAEIARAIAGGDFFIRQIVTQGQVLYERTR